MSNLQIIRRERNTNYTTISNQIFRDRGVSLKARGLFVTVMALPPEWELSIGGLETMLREGRDAIRAAINELIEAGYCHRIRLRDPETKAFVGTEYTFHETPQTLTSEPETDFPTSANPTLENPTQLSTNELNTDQINSVPNGTGVPPSFTIVKERELESGDPIPMALDFSSLFPVIGNQPPLSTSSDLKTESPRVSSTEQDTKKRIFDRGITLMATTGIFPQQARAVIGKWLKKYHEQDVLGVLDGVPEGRVEYISYISEVLKGYTPKDARLKTVEEVTAEREAFANTPIAPPPTQEINELTA